MGFSSNIIYKCSSYCFTMKYMCHMGNFTKLWIYSELQCMHGPKCKLGSFCTVGRRIQQVNVLGGLILPIWGTIEKALSKQVITKSLGLSIHSSQLPDVICEFKLYWKQARQSHRRLRVVRIGTTTDNRRIVGLLVPNAVVGPVLQGLSFSHTHTRSCLIILRMTYISYWIEWKIKGPLIVKK